MNVYAVVGSVILLVGLLTWTIARRTTPNTFARRSNPNTSSTNPDTAANPTPSAALAAVVQTPPEGYVLNAPEGATLSTWSTTGTNRGKHELYRSFPALASSTYTNLFRIRTRGGNYGGGLHHLQGIGTHYNNPVGGYRWSFSSLGFNQAVTVFTSLGTLADEGAIPVTETYSKSHPQAAAPEIRVKYETDSVLIQARVPAVYAPNTGSWSFYFESMIGGTTMLQVEYA